MFGLLKKLFAPRPSTQNKPEHPTGVSIPHVVCKEEDFPPVNTWYRKEHWNSSHILAMKVDPPSGWLEYDFGDEVKVAGISRGKRSANLISLAAEEDFGLKARRDRNNPHDPNAIKVIAVGDGKERMIGYLPKKVAAELAGNGKVKVTPGALFLPGNGYNLGLRVSVWVK